MPPRPALLVADNRAGGTYLTLALSNHPDIYCTRGSPLHSKSAWKVVKGGNLPNLLWSQQFYHVSMFKMGLKVALRHWDIVEGHKSPVKVIFLIRKDVLAQAVSRTVQSLRNHSWEKVSAKPTTLSVARVVKYYKFYQKGRRQIKQLAAKTALPSLLLTYEEITGNVDATCIPKAATKKICNFLGVPVLPLCQGMRKVNPEPPCKWILNWNEILKVVGR